MKWSLHDSWSVRRWSRALMVVLMLASQLTLAQDLPVMTGHGSQMLDAGEHHACAIREDGSLGCWGVANGRQIEPPAGTFAAVSVGDDLACGLRANGALACWGDPALAFPPSGPFSAVSVGRGEACALRPNGMLACWGGAMAAAAPDGNGHVDVGVADGRGCAIRADGSLDCWQAAGVPGYGPAPTGRFIAVDVGDTHACALRSNGQIACWGANRRGQINAPAGAFLAVTAGGDHGCAIRIDGTLACWGDNAAQQLAAPAGRFTAVAAGRSHTCARRENGTMICWGARLHTSTLPAGPGRFGTGAIAVGEHHSCTLRSSGQARCWGDGDLGQRAVPRGYKRGLTAGGDHACVIGGDGTLSCLGDDTHAGATPVSDAVRSAEAGHFNGCAVRGDGEAACWGWNSNGQGAPPTGAFRALATGLNHSCGVRDDGSLACWGYNADGQVSAPAGAFTSVDVGERHSCAVDSNGGLQCWGLGSEGQTVPPVASGVTYRALASGAFHNCAIRSDGGLACWGRNDRGQATPPQGMFVSVAAGFAHTCAIRDTGARVCWGDNDSGQAPQLSITPQTLTSGVVGRFYEVQLGAQSGGDYTPAELGFAVVAGELPSGIQISGTQGSLSGAPDVPGTYAFTLEAIDANGLSGRQEYQLNVLQPQDATSPVIVPIFEGVLGDNGWYRSDVQLRWSITDPDALITSTSNCQDQLVTEDTSNWLQPCIGTTGSGGQIWGWASIRRDATPPQISATSNSPNAAGWYNNSVTYTYTCFDWLSGVVSCPASETVLQEGVGLIVASKTIRDNAGNTAATLEQTHNIDRTPPVVVVTPIGTANNDGWYRDLTLQFSCSDALSGLANPCPWQLDVTTEGWSVSAGTNATDRAGNTTSSFATYKIDRSPPFFQFPSLPYPVRLNANPTVTLNATDHLSGVASASCTPLETATVGEKIMTCTAVDTAGNRNTMSAAYVVGYDIVPAAAPLGSSLSQAFLVSAPRSVPFLWSLRDANGVAVTNATLLRSSVTTVSCPATVVTLATPPAGETTTFENLGAGDYRRNWWINPTLAPNTCQRLDMVLDDGVTHSAIIKVVPKIRITGGPGQPTPQVTPVARPMPAAQRVPRAQQPIRRGVKPAKPRTR